MENEAHTFWEQHYQRGSRLWTGRPNAILAQWVKSLTPGRALDLGCSEGNSAVWLATQGWQVTGVDISETALQRANEHAWEAGVAERLHTEAHDLSQTFPEGRFDLVYALYLESPVNFPREEVLRKAADAVVQDGLLLIVQHGSVAPWSWDQEATFPTPEEAFESLQLQSGEWHVEFLGAPERLLKGPDGQEATVKDIVIALKRRDSVAPPVPDTLRKTRLGKGQ